MSSWTKAANAEFERSRVIVRARSGGRCEAPVHAPGCRGRAKHVHHVYLRSQGRHDAPDDLLDLDPACHDYWHLNRNRARELGIIIDGKSHLLDRPSIVTDTETPTEGQGDEDGT